MSEHEENDDDAISELFGSDGSDCSEVGEPPSHPVNPERGASAQENGESNMVEMDVTEGNGDEDETNSDAESSMGTGEEGHESVNDGEGRAYDAVVAEDGSVGDQPMEEPPIVQLDPDPSDHTSNTEQLENVVFGPADDEASSSGEIWMKVFFTPHALPITFPYPSKHQA